jgi:hypothetical protein
MDTPSLWSPPGDKGGPCRSKSGSKTYWIPIIIGMMAAIAASSKSAHPISDLWAKPKPVVTTEAK